MSFQTGMVQEIVLGNGREDTGTAAAERQLFIVAK